MPNTTKRNIHKDLSQFRFLLCVDLEATCDETIAGPGASPLLIAPEQMETIEIGLIVLDLTTRREVDCFQSFIRPRLNPILTPFCKNLTTISQFDIDDAEGFRETMQRLREFTAMYPEAAWCSWGSYDAKQLQRDDAINSCNSPLNHLPHFNVKDWFEGIHNQRPKGLKSNVLQLGLEWQGVYHRGIDDARNVAAITLSLLGCKAK